MIARLTSEENPGLTFGEVFTQECEHLKGLRTRREVPASDRTLEHDLIGLAFSGGGIRSATFNLGVTQALAKEHLLKYFDYLSTVSGGGYIGSWLSSWAYYISKKEGTNQNHIGRVEQELNREPRDVNDIAEPHQIHFLREYSNYLTPRLGIFSGDTLAFIGTYIRNLVLNQIILISALLAGLLLPRVLGLVLGDFADATSAWVSVGLAMVFLLLLAIGISRNSHDQPYKATNVIWFIALPQFLFCFMITYALWDFMGVKGGRVARWLLCASFREKLCVVGWIVLAYFLLWVVAVVVGILWPRTKETQEQPSWYFLWAPALWSIPGGLAGGAFLLWVSHMLVGLDQGPHAIWYLLTFFVPLVTLLVYLVGVIHLGFIGRAYQDGLREWWARLGGNVLAITVFWFAICMVAFFVPLWTENLRHWFASNGPSRLWKVLGGLGLTGVVTGWITATLTGLFAAKSSKTGPCAPSRTSYDLLARLAPPIFVLGLLVILSLTLHYTVPLLAAPSDPSGYWAMLSIANWWRVLLFCIGLAALSFVVGWRVDVNEFSLHNAYRNRIVRCYLGATHRDREPQPFTGFDETDNIFMHDLLEVSAPFHIVNATLNVVKGKELALQSRKGRSFTFTPLYSGFDYTQDVVVKNMPCTPPAEGSRIPTSDPHEEKVASYRQTQACSHNSRYPGARLGTAMAISGAAVSPNMGHYTSGAVAFLMTVFSVRLGWWIGNPRFEKSWQSGYPRSSWLALFRELTGTTNDDQQQVYLSDGGHFENLAIYELVRRQCRIIVACDAGADPSCVCNDLASAIEKCRVDFHTDIKIDLSEIRPTLGLFPGDARMRVSKTSFTTGSITYPDGSQGILIYIKPSLNTDLPQDVLAYARMATEFPHQSTMDQFFDEAQFESYRALGFACASAATDTISKAIRHNDHR